MTNKPTTPASGGAQEPADDAREAIAREFLANELQERACLHGLEHVPVKLAVRAIAAALKRSPAESGEGAAVCAQCKGFRDDLAPGRDPEELCEPCYDDAVASLATTPPAESGGAQASNAAPLIDLPVDPWERLQVIANAIRAHHGTGRVFSPQIAIADAVDAVCGAQASAVGEVINNSPRVWRSEYNGAYLTGRVSK